LLFGWKGTGEENQRRPLSGGSSALDEGGAIGLCAGKAQHFKEDPR